MSDWLINYEGGFVRRGIIGQILLELYRIHPYNVLLVVLISEIICVLGFFLLIYFLFQKERLSYFLLATALFTGAFTNLPFCTIRRDYLIFLFAYLIFYGYKKYIKDSRKIFFVLMQILSIITILMHEAVFFYVQSLIIVHHLCFSYHETKRWAKSLGKTLLFSFPMLCAMLATIIYKGDTATANAIWESWSPLFESYAWGNSTLGWGVGALAWDTKETLLGHLTMVYGHFYNGIIPSLVVVVPCFFIAYYLFTDFNRLRLFKSEKTAKIDSIHLSNLFIIQFLLMTPLFFGLSCDFVRLFAYWGFSTILFYHFFKRDDWQYMPPLIQKTTQSFQNRVKKNKLLRSDFFYLFCAFIIPVHSYGTPFLYNISVTRFLNEFFVIVKGVFTWIFV